MIIRPDSPLRKLPSNLEEKQALYFDAIRLAGEMVDLSYSRLRHELHIISSGYRSVKYEDAQALKIRHSLTQFAVASVFLDAWSIVDGLHRLRGLVTKIPRLKQKTFPEIRVFRDATVDIENLRNAAQHLNEEINKRGNISGSIWGNLSWFAPLDREFTAGKICTIASGGYPSSQSVPIPRLEELEYPVGFIVLGAHGYSVRLKKPIDAAAKLIHKIDDSAKEEFKKRSERWEYEYPSDSLLCLSARRDGEGWFMGEEV